ncbi:hypothetical protein [Nonomuraea harbinensis]|uniref:Uncharacterized protein n=1 Tax=Nonomuraea harbinensis TaxID=1286938 RepID=A0ABW1BXL0_9ACTN|nr:hypothetical protein [Nonomuraea harbinensis]
MCTRVPAVLLLMLSWFLPAPAHGQVVQVVTAQGVTQQAQQGSHHPGARKSPLPPSTAQARTISYEMSGGAALLPPGPPRPSLHAAAAERPHACAGFTAACQETIPARAPPSSTAL